MQKLISLLLLITVVSVACKKSEHLADKYITLSYKQTYCADPWLTGANDDLTLKNIADYLKAEGLSLAGLTIKQESAPEVCLACQCKTGKTIFITILDSDTLKAQYGEIGFKP